MHSLCLHIVCYVCECERNDAIVCIVYIGLCVCVCIERESQRSLLYIFFVRRDSISALLCASEPVRAYAHGCVCAFQCTCASHCQQLVLRCRQESPVTHITASSHCVLNQLCFSMLSKTLSHTHDACARVFVCARTRAPRRMSGCLSGCTGVGGCVCHVTMITHKGKGQRQLVQRRREMESGTDQMRMKDKSRK